MSLRAVVGFGSNLGDRLAILRAAAGELARIARLEKTSHVYATAPVGGVPQPEFLNAAALVDYEGTPEQLLAPRPFSLLSCTARRAKSSRAARLSPVLRLWDVI